MVQQRGQVSILLFLESVMQRAGIDKEIMYGMKGFNPSFPRIGYATRLFHCLKPTSNNSFNPSFPRIGYATWSPRSCPHNWAFVSILLFLESVMQLVLDSISHTHCLCFNPSFPRIGYATPERPGKIISEGAGVFQSFFS